MAAITTDGTTLTMMLIDKSAMYSLDANFPDLTKWEKGCLRLEDGFVQGVADTAAKNLGGTVTKVWYDNDAGGYFVDISLPEA